jgi:broad specificity phosphatase PhoE
MQVSAGKLVYNRYGLSSALAYAEKNNENAVVSKIKGIYHKLGLDESRKEEMSMEDEEKKEKEEFAKEVEPKGVEDTPEEEKKETPEEQKKEEVSPSEEKKAEEKKEEKMSDDGYLDSVEALRMLREETEEEAQLNKEEGLGEEFAKFADGIKMAADELEKPEGKNFAVVAHGMYCKMCKMGYAVKKMAEKQKVYLAENEQLKSFKQGIDDQRFQFEVEKTLKEVENSMPVEEIDKSREEAKKFSVDNLNIWQNSVKAKAFTFSKDTKKSKKEVEEFPRWGNLTNVDKPKSKYLWEIKQ